MRGVAATVTRGVSRRNLLLGAAMQAAPEAKPWFRDVTSHVFGNVPSFREQLAKGVPYWRARLDVMFGCDVYGSQGIAVGDIDNDGRDEIYICQPGGLPNRLYRIGDDGRAEDITERAAVGLLDDCSSALFVDTRNTGLPDLIVLRSAGPLLFRNTGDGAFALDPEAFRFERQPQGSFTGMAAADYDNDGFVDLYLCSYIYFQSADQYRYPSPYHDARNGPPNYLFHNRDGVFHDVTRASGMDENNDRYSFAAAWCDADGDGRQELYVANDFGRNNYYQWDGERFRDIAAQAGIDDIGPGMSAAWFDAAGSGRFDLYVANMYSEPGQRMVRERNVQPADAFRRHAKGNSLYRNLGRGSFEETRQAEMGRWAWSADGYDFDLDGAAELYVAAGMITGDRGRDNHEFFWDKVVTQTGPAYEEGWNTINQRIREGESWCGGDANVFWAREQGIYVNRSAESGAAFADDSRAFAFTDVDGDGVMDVVLKSRLGPQVRVLRNERGAGKPVIGLRLRGLKSNRDAIGAVLTAGGRVQQVSAGSGYLSQHTRTLYFPAVSSVSIRWPSGLVQKVSGLQAGTLYELEEGNAPKTSRTFARRIAMSSDAVPVDNRPAHVPLALLEPLRYPEAVRGGQGRQVLGQYLRDWRVPFPSDAVFHTNGRGLLTGISVGGKTPGAALPFGGRYVTPPQRALRRLGAAFYAANMPDAAVAYWRDALDTEPHAETANALGLMFARQERDDDAREWFERAIRMDPKHAGAWNNLVVLYGRRNQVAKAIAVFQDAVAACGPDELLYLNLARIQIKAGQREQARMLMEQLLEQKPDSAVAKRALGELGR